jgi:hypothetical protein
MRRNGVRPEPKDAVGQARGDAAGAATLYIQCRVSLFCRHNRFVAECPICSKGTVLDPNRKPERRPRPSSRTRSTGAKRAAAAGATRVSRGPFASTGPYDCGREVRLEKVPGGLRLATWQAGQLLKEAPVLELDDLPGLLRSAAEQGLVPPEELESVGDGTEAAAPGEHGASPGRSGELRDELRVERYDAARLRIARWVMRPNRGWELQEAPVLLPADRFVGALGAAAGRGVLSPGDPVDQ